MRLEPVGRNQPYRPWLGGVEVDVGDAGGGLSGETGDVVVIDVAGLGVEEVEDLDGEAEVARQVVAGVEVEERGRVRAHAAVLDQRPRAEVAPAEAAEEAMRVGHRGADRRGAADRSR